ncbi:hypothetical protein [Sabulicella rubraurantiaca]|uniref:hypothetical protein n=1 Tax=Sabulicella rubraurantiaca TaxID=2811429 RepID=UPI001A9753B2|nr:hypothetical protein [Sabulicella rubraurantiaca]
MKAGRLMAALAIATALAACAGRPPPPSAETDRPRTLPRAPSWVEQPEVMLALHRPDGRI